MSANLDSNAIVVSAPWTTSVDVLNCFSAIRKNVHIVRRRVDWGVGRSSRTLAAITSTLQASWAARGDRTLVMLTAGHEVYVAALAAILLRLLGTPPRLLVVDFLLPRSRRFSYLQSLLRRIDGWVCIRRGDIETLTDLFGIERERCSWHPFPLSASPERFAEASKAARGAGRTIDSLGELPRHYVYSGGIAHRDWGVTLDAVTRIGAPAILAVDPAHPEVLRRTLPPRVRVVGVVTPDVGRIIAAGADVVIVALKDTTLPAGPLVLADALALGCAVVATDANGTRDYVIPGRTAVLTPAGDATALAEAVVGLLADPPARTRLGTAARAWAEENLQPADFVDAILAIASRTSPRHG